MAENNRYLHHHCYRAISNIGMFGCLFRYKRFHVAHPDVLCNQSQSSLLRDYSMGFGSDILIDRHASYFLVERKKKQEIKRPHIYGYCAKQSSLSFVSKHNSSIRLYTRRFYTFANIFIGSYSNRNESVYNFIIHKSMKKDLI